MSARFGFLPESTCLTWRVGSIEPLADHEALVQRVLDHPQHYAGCWYPPQQKVRRVSRESKGPPSISSAFALPPTHLLTLTICNADSRAQDFFIALFGMLKGLRLQREGWQHLYKCPTQRGALCDFYASDGEIATTLNQAAEFWQQHTGDEIRKLAFGAIHWHLFAQLYEHGFERFNAQYMALDTCWKLATQLDARFAEKGVSHAKRAQVLGQELQILLPEWTVVPDDSNASILSVWCNALIHEALYGDQPVGFAHPDDGQVERELTCFCCSIGVEVVGCPERVHQVIVNNAATMRIFLPGTGAAGCSNRNAIRGSSCLGCL